MIPSLIELDRIGKRSFNVSCWQLTLRRQATFYEKKIWIKTEVEYNIWNQIAES